MRRFLGEFDRLIRVGIYDIMVFGVDSVFVGASTECFRQTFACIKGCPI